MEINKDEKKIIKENREITNNQNQENNISENINNNMKKLSPNNDLEDEGKETEITGQILFRRIMGKKLCSVTILNEEKNLIMGVSIHDPEIIPKLKIGDMIYIKGRKYHHRNNPKNKNIQAEIVNILGKDPGAEKIYEKRKFFFDNKTILTNYNALCTFNKKGQK